HRDRPERRAGRPLLLPACRGRACAGAAPAASRPGPCRSRGTPCHASCRESRDASTTRSVPAELLVGNRVGAWLADGAVDVLLGGGTPAGLGCTGRLVELVVPLR